ncbi:MAG: putative glycosyltransferase EpsE [Syntrophus sp. PtaB.Bin075]|nr:MAG: putative glycosyltransferase EpsE [Syntrophus sp. PtaB.Bin075]
MAVLSVVLQPPENQEQTESMLAPFLGSPLVETIWIASRSPLGKPLPPRCRQAPPDAFSSGAALNDLLCRIETPWLLMIPDARRLEIPPPSLERLLEVAEITGAGLVYADFRDRGTDGRLHDHPLIDYSMGSIRDTFDFGPLILFSVPAISQTLKIRGAIPPLKHAALYDLRLKLSLDSAVFHLQEFLCTRTEIDSRSSGEKIFDYVRSDQQAVQKEMENVAMDHLQRLGAYLPPEFRDVESAPVSFPVEASVIIPVKNRRKTIGGAVKSALSQETTFPFNIIVVDNHSTDGTTAVLSDLSKRQRSLHHLIPVRTDLGIGGCWNEALRHEACGRYAVQLDSDDLYSRPDALQQLVNLLRTGHYAMVIGSYTLVNEHLEEISPGLIDHREWTPENGRNNALRINGLGAPRAFSTEILRKTGFLNVGYGEDYALALQLSRYYKIGRIYESLYLCRRWTDNTDAALPIEKINRNDLFKDRIRTLEILARQRQNGCKP